MPKNELRSPILERLKEVLGFYRYSDPNYTLRNLAQYCRVSEKTIYNWLKSKTRPNRLKMRLIEEWLESRSKSGESEVES